TLAPSGGNPCVLSPGSRNNPREDVTTLPGTRFANDRPRRNNMRALVALLGLLLLAGPPSARAGGSSPLLTIAAVDAFASSSAALSVDIQGSFNFEDVVQGVFPAGAVVFQGTSFARF